MPPRLTILLCTIITAIGITRCDHQVQYRRVPFPVQRYFQLLPAWDSPQKIEVDYRHHKVYWLNKKGEIRSIRANGNEETLINKGIGAQLGITYISDFAINDREGILYFTDLMDVSTGLSALKKSDLNGSHIETIATFSDKIPYAVHWDRTNEQLYYAVQQKSSGLHILCRLGISVPLITTTGKVNDISTVLTTQTGPHEIQMVADQLPVITN